jgi:glycosyltransferase involved in cell wall biosynthesis/SAM-dependent methyltransferase
MPNHRSVPEWWTSRRRRFARLLRPRPFSPSCGYDRGLPVDRNYIEGFLDRHRLAIHGRVLEMGDDVYTRRFGDTRVRRSDVLDLRADRPGVTIAGDLASLDGPLSAFDCIIFTQALQYLADPAIAVRRLHDLLRPGGTLLATFPAISHIVPDLWSDRWRWCASPLAAHELFEAVFSAEGVTVRGRGNALAVTAFLQGLATEELPARALDQDDPAYPLVVTVNAVRSVGSVNSRQAEPVVSVVIPCYNQSRFLAEAVQSALTQTHSRTEVIVVDDGSTDDSYSVAVAFPTVRVLRQGNMGLAAARNAGLKASSGDFVVFLDADDRLLPQAAETGLAHLLAHPDWAFVSGEHRYIDTAGRVTDEWTRPAVTDSHYQRLLEGNYIGMCATVLYRRAAFDVCGLFNGRWRGCEDYELYFRIARRLAIGSHPLVIAEYRRYGTALSDNPALMLQSSISVLRSQRRFVRHDPSMRAAYRKGLAWWRRYYALPLAIQIRRHLRSASTRLQAVRDARVLLRFAPLAGWQILRGRDSTSGVR